MIACGSLDYARKVAQAADYTHFLQAINMYMYFPALILKVIDFGRIVMKVRSGVLFSPPKQKGWEKDRLIAGYEGKSLKA